MKQLIPVSLLLGLAVVPLFGQDDSPWDPGNEKKQPGLSVAGAPSLDALKKRLTSTYEAIASKQSINGFDLYVQALARMDAVGPAILKKPQSPAARNEFVACSLLTEAAVAQIRARENQLKILSLHGKVNAALTELDTVHEAINSAERSHASKLRADLDAEKESARKLRDEAEKKFSELQSTLIQVSKDARGTIISMSDILFDVGKATLTGDLRTSLAKIAGILIVFKDSKVVVEGHTDNVGGEQYNQELSEQRALNVMNFLIDQGVDPPRLRALGYGFSSPIAENETKEGRQKNRRVDLVVQEKSAAEE